MNRVWTSNPDDPLTRIDGPKQITGIANLYTLKTNGSDVIDYYYNFGTNVWQSGKMSTSTLEVTRR